MTDYVRDGLIVAGATVFLFLAWAFVSPTVQGYHIGYNFASDNVCMSRVVQWCRHDQNPPTSTPLIP